MHAKKTGFVVEHDFIMATYLADRVIVFEGTPSMNTMANSPQSLLNGMNRFLELLGITFRRDPNNFRPRINKTDSVKDTEQSYLFSADIIAPTLMVNEESSPHCVQIYFDFNFIYRWQIIWIEFIQLH